MPRTLMSIAAAAMIALLPYAASADATPPPPVAGSAFTGHAHAHITASFNGAPIEVNAHLTVAQRDGRSRVDLSFDPGPLPMLPNGPIVLVTDAAKQTLTVWNPATKRYVVQSLVPKVQPAPSPSASAMPAPRPTAPARSFLADLDVFALDVQLAGHATVDGLPTTGVNASIDVRRRGSTATARVRATLALADDFAFFPVTITASIDPASPAMSAAFTYALDDVSREQPPLTLFDPPAGYEPADSILGVLAKGPR